MSTNRATKKITVKRRILQGNRYFSEILGKMKIIEESEKTSPVTNHSKQESNLAEMAKENESKTEPLTRLAGAFPRQAMLRGQMGCQTQNWQMSL
jgi:hypothetical protein